MERNTIVLLIAHNEKEKLQRSVESIRQWEEADDIRIVVVDNASEDGTKEWLSAQPDISFATEEKRVDKWGKIVNEAIECFPLEGDILFLQPGCTVGAGCVSKLKEALHAREEIAAVGPLIQGENKKTKGDFSQSDDKGNRIVRVLELDADVIMISGDAVNKYKKMDERYDNYTFVILDYILSLIKAGKQLFCVVNAEAERREESSERDVWKDVPRIRSKWEMQYFSLEGNEELIDMFTEEKDVPISVLEIGCDCGATLLRVKNRYPNASIYGFEINEYSSQIAATFAEVAIGNIEKFNLPYRPQQFDYILFGDVLEHLHDPAGVISYCRKFLKTGGSIVACIPNLMNISVVKDLLEGYFTYGEVGLLDKTHIHMFTFKEMARMFMDAEYSIEDVSVKTNPLSEEEKDMLDKIMGIVHESERWMFEAFQFLIRAEKR